MSTAICPRSVHTLSPVSCLLSTVYCLYTGYCLLPPATWPISSVSLQPTQEDSSFKRKLSKREKKELKKQEKKEKVEGKSGKGGKEEGMADKLYTGRSENSVTH